MNKSDFGYCGLNCATCKERFANIRDKATQLEEAFDRVNIGEMVKMIPFMGSRYRGYKKLVGFFESECPGCTENGGNPFCGIRKCARKKEFATCVECESDMCDKFKSILKVHADNEIQNNREIIRSIN